MPRAPTPHARTHWVKIVVLVCAAALVCGWVLALSHRSPFQPSERDIVVAAAVESYDRARLAHRVVLSPEQVEERLVSDNPEGNMTVDTAMRILEDAIARASNLNADDLIKGFLKNNHLKKIVFTSLKKSAQIFD
jgi:hypothetical protein